MLKTVVAVVIAAFLVFYVVSSPKHAANIANGAWDHTVSAAHGLGHFVDDLG